jgi:ribose 5-phosphate isomerase A
MDKTYISPKLRILIMQNNTNKEHLIPMIKNIIENYFLKLSSQVNSDEKKKNIIIGLGSGSTVAELIKRLSHIPNKENFKFIPTSIQIKMIGEMSGLEFTDESKINDIDLVIDGADQIDANLNMIKGGGGALLKEKIIMYTAKEKIILAESNKFVTKFNIPIPIEVHPFARFTIMKKLQAIRSIDNLIIGDSKFDDINYLIEMNILSKPIIRTVGKGYPFITENGNIIIDTEFSNIVNVEKAEQAIKNIPGVVEVGLFSRKNNTKYYSVNSQGKFSIQST